MTSDRAQDAYDEDERNEAFGIFGLTGGSRCPAPSRMSQEAFEAILDRAFPLTEAQKARVKADILRDFNLMRAPVKLWSKP